MAPLYPSISSILHYDNAQLWAVCSLESSQVQMEDMGGYIL